MAYPATLALEKRSLWNNQFTCTFLFFSSSEWITIRVLMSDNRKYQGGANVYLAADIKTAPSPVPAVLNLILGDFYF